MSKQVILTGLRANNDLTLGNYFGAMRPIIDMAKTKAGEFQVNMFIPDLHSFTTPVDHAKLQDQILHNAVLFAAAGLPLDNPDIHLYRQSYVSAHSEATIILNNFVGMGEMARMTQFKVKTKATNEEIRAFFSTVLEEKYPHLLKIFRESSDDEYKKYEEEISEIFSRAHDALNEVKNENATVGLFDYPVLMAADILLYGATYVPVGDDQTQHLEITRDIAERINSRFGEIFTIPVAVKDQHEFFNKDQGLRIMDLQDPTKKMSKSDDSGKGVIFLGDNPDDAYKKVMSATTDDKASVNYDRENQPGITNLLDILALLRGVDAEEVIREFTGMERYGDFKKVVASEMRDFLVDFQARVDSVDMGALETKMVESEVAMSKQANETLVRLQKVVGLR